MTMKITQRQMASLIRETTGLTVLVKGGTWKVDYARDDIRYVRGEASEAFDGCTAYLTSDADDALVTAIAMGRYGMDGKGVADSRSTFELACERHLSKFARARLMALHYPEVEQPAKPVPKARSVVIVDGASPTIMHAVTENYRTVITDGASFINDAADSYVRRWTRDGGSRQSFGHWTGSMGGALMWDRDAHAPEDKARQIAKDLRIPFLDDTAYAAWRAVRCAEEHPGELFFVSEDGEWDRLSPDCDLPYLRGANRLAYCDATGEYAIERTGAPGGSTDDPYRLGRMVYTLTHKNRPGARIVRPWPDRDKTGPLADAIRAALAEARIREREDDARADAEIGQPPSCL